MRTSRIGGVVLSASAMFGVAQAAGAAIIVFTDPGLPGLAAEAEFNLVNATTLEVRLRNVSTGAPGGFGSADQLLTGVSFDLPGGLTITGGAGEIGPNSQSIDFDTGSYGPGTNIGGEWGFGNSGLSGALRNAISGNSAGITDFGGPNLDGPAGLNGPQGGLVANPAVVSLGGLGAIQDEAIFVVTLSGAIDNLSWLLDRGVRVEFGSDAAFITVPAPASIGLLTGVTLLTARRRRA